ncbi:ABC transporter ATP-binding protein [Cupriavidus taiwanensis]|uniref:Putative putative Binding-protein-dependent transporter,ATP_binding component n=1 Tax=Cupriavidus taiwanensis TaxID=164546 RepID=A0A7Z7NK86_9BURK|nr:AAA-associated domain-containing protein [Cupriavidus taiwanensis]SOY89481.1 putative putative Binding-protein-dependent transporter,ATP_binding component [Cupriavidus taiwanensis]SOZ03373.1 putative putative Binding-protein-dependent transporter,ATP_binding component [Cupriavidus taiwanensis]SOZ08876.1 putative putative Binding-protein-dependent transporter,ATP_binding component [Cupriavidus taiwanensis]SPC07162.1 putative putative Binding-protein-dependent transporter,ATP_binding component
MAENIATPTAAAVIELRGVGKIFRTASQSDRAVLEGVDLTLREGEIVAMLGKSGSGKSTLLRIMAGLVGADRGEVRFRGQRLAGTADGIAMVFQSFALFPWLTVQQNVELGLEAQGVPRAERERRAEAAIDMIGLAGFNSALPRELSGGMRQRVGIARALVTEPDLLLMDEAFSALDVLTGETLRDEMLALWESGRANIKGILIVSHNIEEAVMMADRIVILSSDPGRIRAEVPVALPRPRNRDSAQVRALVDQIYALMTAPAAEARVPAHAREIGYRLPDADISQMEAILDLLCEAPFHCRADLPHLADEAGLTDDELLPACEALQLVQLVSIEAGDIAATDAGRAYYAAGPQQRKAIFGRQLLANVALAAHVRRELVASEAGEIREEQVLEELEQFLKPAEAERVLSVAIGWGRYGEIFEYSYHSGMLTLPEDEGAGHGI